MSHFEECFDRHNFNELNSFDYDMLYNVFLFYVNRGFRTDGIFLDVGSNGGSFVKVLDSFGLQNNIHCFEPHPIIQQKTKELYPYITMNNYCLGNMDGWVDIYIPHHFVLLSSMIRRPVFSQLGQEIHTLNVPCKRIDTYCKENGIDEIDFLKIDVEGAEKMVLEGASDMLSNRQIKCGIFEVGQTLYDANTTENEICDLLLSYGYIIDRSFSHSDIVFYLP